MMRENAYQNQNPDHFKQIPRTSDPRVKEMVSIAFYNDSVRQMIGVRNDDVFAMQAKPREPAEFAAQLMAKLEKLKKDQETDELMALKLSTVSWEQI